MTDAHLEIERKFLILRPDEDALRSRPGAECYRLSQTYLASPSGVNRRVRRAEGPGGVRYFYTEKVTLSSLVRRETENQISEAEYQARLREADPGCATVTKTRWVIPHGGRRAEIDLFPFWEEWALLEIECESEEAAAALILPDFLTVVRELTDERGWTNHSLAQTLARGEIPSPLPRAKKRGC